MQRNEAVVGQQPKTRNTLMSGPAIVATVLLSACQSEPIGGPLTIEVAAPSSVAILQTINSAGQRCWIQSNDRQFRAYRLIPELDTIAGNPRILLVDAKATTSRPELVIESTSEPIKVSTYGPVVQSKLGNRINADIIRWSTGDTRCADSS